MSLQHLEEHGVLLPEEEWGTHSLEPTIHRPVLVGAFTLAVASLVGIWMGHGALWTWVSIGTFLVGLYTLAFACDRAVTKQRRRVREERRSQRGAAGSRRR